jgi:small nuclear ribonucleoprotein (snRNP)-like protein
MIEQLIGQKVVIDLRSSFVCLGTMVGVDEHFLELKQADLHDLRDTKTTRENYVVDSVRTGIKFNRKRLWLVRAEMVGLARLDEVVVE